MRTSPATLIMVWALTTLVFPGFARAQDRGPFDAIYPPQQIPLAFDHAVHLAKAKADCKDCHASVSTSVRTADRNLPEEQACLDCHDVLEENPEQASPKAACSTCHPGYVPTFPEGVPRDQTKAATPHPPRVELGTAALKFSHQSHLQRGITCDRCHVGLEKASLGTRDHLPMMDQCTSCHDGRQASSKCATCHISLPDGRLQTALPTGTLLPRGLFRNDDHAGDFARTHGPAAQADSESCAACHTPKMCGACHTGKVKPLSIHAADYILTHPAEARRDDPTCSTCHRAQTFCVDCHVRSGVTDQSGPLMFNAAGNATRSFHPPGFVDSLGGVPSSAHHKFEARRNLKVCVGCHQEESCTRCHAVDAPAYLRASPHPQGFSRHCGRALRDNDRGCVKCHGSRAALEAMCER